MTIEGETETGRSLHGPCLGTTRSMTPTTVLSLLFPKLADGADPFIRHELVAGIGGVDAVPDPVVGRGALAGGVEDRLEADEGGMVFLGEAGDDFTALLGTGAPGFVVLLSRADGEREGFA